MDQEPKDLLNIDDVDQLTINLVNGFIKNAQKLFVSYNDPYFNIPELVNKICISYCKTAEKFVLCGDGVTISGKNDSKIATVKNMAGWSCGYGAVEIDASTNLNKLYSWTFDRFGTWILIGITSKKNILNNFIANEKSGYHYMLHFGVKIMYHYYGNIDNTTTFEEIWTKKVQTKNTFRMELNLKDKCLRYIINDKVVAEKNIYTKTTYNMAVCISGDQRYLRLIDYKEKNL